MFVVVVVVFDRAPTYAYVLYGTEQKRLLWTQRGGADHRETREVAALLLRLRRCARFASGGVPAVVVRVRVRMGGAVWVQEAVAVHVHGRVYLQMCVVGAAVRTCAGDGGRCRSTRGAAVR